MTVKEIIDINASLGKFQIKALTKRLQFRDVTRVMCYDTDCETEEYRDLKKNTKIMNSKVGVVEAQQDVLVIYIKD